MQELVRLGVDPSAGDDVGNTVMHYAAACDVPALLDALLAAGVSPEVRHARTHETPLFTAIMHDREPQFQALLAAGADVNAADANENRPIHVAAKVNDVVRVERLLEAGADPLVRNYQGVTFQRYLNATADAMRSAPLRAVKKNIDEWLQLRGVPLEG